MTNQIDEQELTNYLKRESEFSRRYQAVDTDEVPAELDQAILLRATEAATKTNSSSGNVTSIRLRKWRALTVPFAVAATLVISVSIVTRTYKEPLVTSSKQREEPGVEVQLYDNPAAPMITAPNIEAPMPIESAPASSPLSPAPKMDAPLAPAELERRIEASPIADAADKNEQPLAATTPAKEVAAQAVMVEEKPPAPASPAALSNAMQKSKLAKADQSVSQRSRDDSAEVSEVVVTGARAERKQTTFGPHGTATSVPPRQEASTDQYQKELREANPAAWLEYIRELRQAKKNFAANREWKRFVKAYPTYEVAIDDAARGK